MERLDKIKLAIQKGITCNPETGQVFGVRGNNIGKKTTRGYIELRLNNHSKIIHIMAHQFIWYWVNKEVVDCIDHINRVTDDNRIDNLRLVTHQENMYNLSPDKKGYHYNKINKKWISSIRVYPDRLYLGSFNTEQEAKQAYLDAKKIYHILK